ncbi:hypothetical protein GCM10010331_45390 [Streptomyces xanthochromogenes]|uniref:hypothetical protein n=1 Tax=Streptomyces xanthochromogenes TaxID=67384 RepID=UPI001674F257|nr:hypothetical protein [Streptomyces xanthochromogenes]GHB52674.1 hypothetical protein GCM10010331_45390 [Streptomyces xanthochromogenes]
MKAPRARRKAIAAPSSLDDLFASRSKDKTFLAEAKAHVIEKNANDNSRRQDIIHPSEVAKASWCPRATYQRIETGIHHKEKFGFQSLNIFDSGHEAHRKWQNRAWSTGWLEGNFKCLNCEQLWWDKSPATCDRCSSSALEYAEVPLRAVPTHRIAGHADGLLTPIRKILEIKTVGEGTYRYENPKLLARHTHKDAEGRPYVDVKGLWTDTRVPFPSHVRQVQIYIWLANTFMQLEVDGAEFIYESKMNQDVKSFTIKANFDVIADRIALCQEINERLGKNDPPACPKGGCKDCNAYEESDDGPARRRGTNPGADDRETPAGEGAETPAAARRGRSRTHPGSDRTRRRRTDVDLCGDDQLGRVRRNSARPGGSRREAG